MPRSALVPGRVLDQAPTGDGLLDEALASMGGQPTARAWVTRDRGELVRRYLERLAAAGVIQPGRRRYRPVGAGISRRRYPGHDVGRRRREPPRGRRERARGRSPLGGGVGGGAGPECGVPAGEGTVPVERDGWAAVAGEFGVPVLDGDAPQDLELDAARVLGVQRLRQAVVALADQGAGVDQALAGVHELGEGADLPRQVVEADPGAAVGVARAYLEQAQVMVVDRVRGAEEGRLAGYLHADLEAERPGVELDLAGEAVDVKHRVVEPAHCHGRTPAGFVGLLWGFSEPPSGPSRIRSG